MSRGRPAGGGGRGGADGFGRAAEGVNLLGMNAAVCSGSSSDDGCSCSTGSSYVSWVSAAARRVDVKQFLAKCPLLPQVKQVGAGLVVVRGLTNRSNFGEEPLEST